MTIKHQWKYDHFVQLLREGKLTYDPETGVFMRLYDARCGWLVSPRRAVTIRNSKYHELRARIDESIVIVQAHVVAWMYVHGAIPDGLEINHKNGIRGDNRIDNLEIVTRAANNLHKYRVLGQRPVKGNVLLTSDDVCEMRTLYNTGRYLQWELGAMFGVSQATVSGIVSGNRWRDV